METAVSRHQLQTEVRPGGESLAEVPELGHTQLASLTELDESLAGLVRDVLTEVLAGETGPPAGLTVRRDLSLLKLWKI